MATSTQISMGEYLIASYRPDLEYVDGELLKRNVGRNEHSRLPALLAGWFEKFEEAWRVAAFASPRVEVSATRIRIPDVLLVARAPHPDVLVDPPILIVEIFAGRQLHGDAEAGWRLLRHGSRDGVDCRPGEPDGTFLRRKGVDGEEELRVAETAIWVSLPELFERLDRTLVR